jgi:uncharacterized protein involved in tolerance to divalent cations
MPVFLNLVYIPFPGTAYLNNEMIFTKSLLVQYVMNSTCIHLRTGGSNIYVYKGEIYKDSNIYMYMKVKYIKNPMKKYNNRKSNIHLASPSNSWWINNIKFGKVKLMMDVSLYLHEEI